MAAGSSHWREQTAALKRYTSRKGSGRWSRLHESGCSNVVFFGHPGWLYMW